MAEMSSFTIFVFSLEVSVMCNVMWHFTPSHHDINKFCVCVCVCVMKGFCCFSAATRRVLVYCIAGR